MLECLARDPLPLYSHGVMLCAEVEAELQGKLHPECQAVKEAMLAGVRGLALAGNFLWWSRDASQMSVSHCAQVEAELQGEPHPECQAMLACIRGPALPGNLLWWSRDS